MGVENDRLVYDIYKSVGYLTVRSGYLAWMQDGSLDRIWSDGADVLK